MEAMQKQAAKKQEEERRAREERERERADQMKAHVWDTRWRGSDGGQAAKIRATHTQVHSVDERMDKEWANMERSRRGKRGVDLEDEDDVPVVVVDEFFCDVCNKSFRSKQQ